MRRATDADWVDVRRLHLRLSLGLPMVVDVELNEVMATPDAEWQRYVHICATAEEQALFVAVGPRGCAGMGHVRLEGRRGRLSLLFVEADRRRHGGGGALVAAQAEWARAAGADSLVCHIPETSHAVALARRLGWSAGDDVFFTQNALAERRWSVPLDAEGPAEDSPG